MDTGDEEQLVRRAREGDTRAFEELVVSHERAIYTLALRMSGNAEDARDLTQEVFVKAWRNLARFDGRHRFFSWVYRIAVHEALNLRRSRRPEEPLNEGLVAPGETPEDSCCGNQVARLVQEALEDLPEGYRQVILLRHFLHQSHRDMGETLQVPEKTVKSRLFTARRLLAAALKRRGVTAA